MIHVKDVNDNPPVFERPTYRTQITEEDDRNLPKRVLQVNTCLVSQCLMAVQAWTLLQMHPSFAWHWHYLFINVSFHPHQSTVHIVNWSQFFLNTSVPDILQIDEEKVLLDVISALSSVKNYPLKFCTAYYQFYRLFESKTWLVLTICTVLFFIHK